MSNVFHFDIKVDQVDLKVVEKLAIANNDDFLQQLGAPPLDNYVVLESLIKLDEGTGGAIMKLRCSQNRQSVVIKVLKQFIELNHVYAHKEMSDVLFGRLSISRSHSVKKPTIGNSVVRESIAATTRNSSVQSLSSTERSTESLNQAIQLEEVKEVQKKVNYAFDSLNEYLIMKKLESQYITPAYGIFTTDILEDAISDLCFMMDYYVDSDLLNLLTKVRKLSIPISIQLKDQLFLQIVQGVKFMHTHNVAHRDLKPENILIDYDGRLRICDFGYAVDTDRLDKYPIESPSFITRGTGSFKAPELLSFVRKSMDPHIPNEGFTGDKFKSSDIWSLGVLYYQMKFLTKPWINASFEDFNYQWFANTYRKNKLNTLSNGYDIKKKLNQDIDGGSPVSQQPTVSMPSHQFKLVKTDSSSSNGSITINRMRSTSNGSILRTSSQSQFNENPGETLSKTLKSMKDSTLFGLMKLLNPDWKLRIDAKTVLKIEWLVNTRLTIEENLKKGKKEEDFLNILKMIRKA